MHNAPKNIIKLLLDKDEKKESIFKQTHSGRHALHIAIEQKAEKDVIELLLKADNDRIISTFDEERSVEVKYRGLEDSDDIQCQEKTIEVKYKGMVGFIISSSVAFGRYFAYVIFSFLSLSILFTLHAGKATRTQ